MAQVRKQRPRPAPRAPMSPTQAATCCRPVDGMLDPVFFKALGDATRVRLLGCLVKCGRACSVTEIAACCSVDLSVVSRHLQSLARAGLLEPTRSGRTVWYQVRYAHLARTLRDLADAVEDCGPATDARCREACRGRC